MLRLVILTSVCLSIGSAAATGQTPWANKLFDNQTSHDFGAVPPGAQLKHTFKVTNIYKVPLDITDIRLSCDCVKVDVVRRSLKPTESTELVVSMDARRFAGPRTVKIHVTVGPKFTSTAILTVSANARGEIALSPAEIDFGSVSSGSTPTKTIDVEYVGNTKAWRVVEIRNSSSAPFTLKVDHLPPDATGAVRKGYRLSATLKSDAATGTFKQEIVLKTNDAKQPSITIQATGSVQPGLVLSPDTLAFNGIKVGEVQERKVFLRAARAISILKVDGHGDAGITVDVPRGSETTHVLTIRFAPKQSGDFRRQLTVVTDAGGATVRLTVEAKVDPAK